MKFRVCFQLENAATLSTRSIEVPVGTPLHEAALGVGLPIRSDCGGQGTCGKCVVRLKNEDKLACRISVDADLDVTVPAASLQYDSLVVQHRNLLETVKIPENRRDAKHRYGVALDIGTTTLAAELFELAGPEARFSGVVSRANPQRNFGNDVISRIQKIIEEPGFLAMLQSLVIGAATDMLDELAEEAGIERTDISIVTVAGNTVMEHIFLGIDPSPLGFAPFTPPVSEFPNCRGDEIGMDIAPESMVETMPILGGFVGGDIVAGVLATELCKSDENGTKTAMLIDIGTNGELVLWHDGELYAAATAAGPAFEGGRIEYGMTAAAGAVDRVSFGDDGTITVSTIGDKPAIGICGSGLIDLTSEMLRHGLIAPNGRFDIKPSSPFLSRWKIIDDVPAFVLVPAEFIQGKSSQSEAILLTQRDVRQLQLATGAIRAGIVLLLRQFGLAPHHIETLYVAGGFGSFIAPESARRIGLLPKEIPIEKIRFCGNTSLAGARLALLDPHSMEEGHRLARQCHHVELASLPDFATVFAESMIF